jgi:histone H3/H4
MLDGKPHMDKISIINIERLGKKFRLQSSSFKIAREVYESLKPAWRGNKESLFAHIAAIARHSRVSQHHPGRSCAKEAALA